MQSVGCPDSRDYQRGRGTEAPAYRNFRLQKIDLDRLRFTPRIFQGFRICFESQVVFVAVSFIRPGYSEFLCPRNEFYFIIDLPGYTEGIEARAEVRG